MKILFSHSEMPESSVHVVAQGDSLYKIAKKYNTTIDLIKKSNSLTKDIIRPGMKFKVLTAKASLSVDKSENALTLFLDGRPFKRYVVATGSDDKTPVGEFKIAVKVKDPTWYKIGAVVPPGDKENMLGTRWMGFEKPAGYGIHGTTKPESIGKHSTSGCIRMLNADAEELYVLLPLGTPVTVVG